MRITDETDAGPPVRSLSPEERQATVDRLCVHYARDALTASELELRLDLAYAARTRAELVSLEHDLPALESETRLAPPPAEAPSSVPIDPSRAVRERDLIVSIWGGTERKGGWTPARRLMALTLMGGAELDFREAVFTTREVSGAHRGRHGRGRRHRPTRCRRGVGRDHAYGRCRHGAAHEATRYGRSRSTDQRNRMHGRRGCSGTPAGRERQGSPEAPKDREESASQTRLGDLARTDLPERVVAGFTLEARGTGVPRVTLPTGHHRGEDPKRRVDRRESSAPC